MTGKYFLLMIIILWSGIPGFLFQDFRRFLDNSNQLCPRECSCSFSTVRCTFRKLTYIPRVSGSTTVLDLRFNEIVNIALGNFENLKNLHTLLLNDNLLRYLQKDAFYGLENLKILYLFKNQIENIEPGVFDNLPKLEHLYLHYNYLTEIRKGTFNNLPALQKISLQNNDIRRIEFDAFHNIGSNSRLQIDSKALECTCNLIWLIEHIKKRPSNEINAVCDSPADMKGKRLDAMSYDDFHCSKPKIMKEPEDTTVGVGETIIFHCKVSGDPAPDVKWMRDSTEVAIDGERYQIQDDGTLTIFDANENDNGNYECIAHNDMGFTNSRRARALITASEFLRFIEIPISQTVEAGVDVTFTCRVEGEPSPHVEWWKNGRLILAGGRFQFDDSGSILKIEAVKQSDSARYICRGKNIDGLAETSADLTVLQEDFRPPEMTYQPQDMEVENGASIEIPCRARGNPKPTIQWKKDGIALDSNRNIPLDRNRFRLSKGGSLYLYNITVQDAGRYECSAINEHGRATGQALLQIRKTETSDAIVLRAFQEARSEIDRAINNTLQSLFNGDSKHYKDLFRLSRFPPAEGRAAARPAELFERTLQNIRRLVKSGTTANVTDQFIYEEILTREQIVEIERLSGCTGHRRKDNCNNLCFHKRYRTIDGRCNNFDNPTWGSSYTGFRRILKPIYENGFSTPVGWDKTKLYNGHRKPAARLVSTSLISTHNITSDNSITHMVMQWGQFLDHDLDHALPAVSSETWDGIDCKKSCDNAPPCFPMEVPQNDPRVTNRRCIDFFRTSAVCGSGETSILWGKLTPREQLNQLTSYLDASQVYGYDDDVARDLRDFTSDRGLLREGAIFPNRKALLPYASNGQFVDCRRDPLESSINCFLTGDFRANEQVGLLAMHTIWMREHNRIARRLFEINPHWRGEKIYQETRKIVGAEMQRITFNNWLPTILGDYLPLYRGYNSKLDATISNVFATAALRFGHSLIQPRLERLNDNFSSIPQGPLELRDAFFSPWRLVEEGGVDPLIRGMFATAAKLKLPEQNLNIELTEQLFRVAHAVALDLAAMNIQRSRDHALPGYNDWRKYCNMTNVETFDDLKNEITNERVREKLHELYGHPGNIDIWVGGILEDQLPNAKVGPLFKCLLTEQFQRMRDGDRFWYENPTTFKNDQLEQIKLTNFARILCDNGDNITRIQKDIFHLPNDENPLLSCDDIPSLDLRMWNECCEDCQDQENIISRSRRSTMIRYSNRENLMKKFNFNENLNREEKMEFIHHLMTENDEKNELLKKLTNEMTDKMVEIKSLLEEIEEEYYK
ncbi:peroxidasin homolog [Leptopilina boulardi]|uniref:peroxidasin homolog n=1 Tax=Leptopilina boulardi TaxID=63433 RepID=UPI0021F53DD3|nr:peroxidasin homolog [Leptopilina boulardi]